MFACIYLCVVKISITNEEGDVATEDIPIVALAVASSGGAEIAGSGGAKPTNLGGRPEAVR